MICNRYSRWPLLNMNTIARQLYTHHKNAFNLHLMSSYLKSRFQPLFTPSSCPFDRQLYSLLLMCIHLLFIFTSRTKTIFNHDILFDHHLSLELAASDLQLVVFPFHIFWHNFMIKLQSICFPFMAVEALHTIGTGD